jgi:hypothetical protein
VDGWEGAEADPEPSDATADRSFDPDATPWSSAEDVVAAPPDGSDDLWTTPEVGEPLPEAPLLGRLADVDAVPKTHGDAGVDAAEDESGTDADRRSLMRFLSSVKSGSTLGAGGEPRAGHRRIPDRPVGSRRCRPRCWWPSWWCPDWWPARSSTC